MCGLMGMAGDGIIQKDLDFMEELMKVSTLRGTDGTGIFQGRFRDDRNPTYFIEKRAIEVNQFFTLNKNKLVLGSIFDNVFIGHVRSATRATLSDDNCHPFEFGEIIGAHNGTLNDNKYYSKEVVDSALLYQDISERGHLKVLGELHESSAYALTWFNMRTRDLYFARNVKRPLAVVNSKERDVLYWASEIGMLKWLTERHGFKTHSVGYFETDKVYSINVEEITDKDCQFGIEKVIHRPPPAPKIKYKAKGKDKHKWNNKLTAAEWARVFGQPLTPEIDTTGVPWSDDRTLAVPVPRIKNNKGKVPHVSCFCCLRPLSLMEQYNAARIPVDGVDYYECNLCQEMGNAILEQHKDRVHIN